MEMKIIYVLSLLSIFFFASYSNAECQDKVKPALGDLCLEPPTPDSNDFSFVLIYYTDGIQLPGWGTICHNLASKDAFDLMCRQLGYSGVEDQIRVPIPSSSDIKPWLANVKCDGNAQNILRCDPKIGVNECDSVIALKCKNDSGWNKIPEKGYEGQVMLLHPNSFDNSILGHQVSFGLVLIYLSDKNGGTWGPINQINNHTFTRSAADSVCRQMGYTEADPYQITTVQYSNTSYSQMLDNAWLMNNATMECHTSASCFSCCFSPPTQKCSDNVCKFTNNLVLQCLFDPHSKLLPSSGNNVSCKISGKQKPSSCTSSSFPYQTLSYAANGVLFFFLLVVFIILGCTCCICHRKNRLRRGENQPLLNNLNEQHQN